MDIVIGTALFGAVCGPWVARCVYELAVDHGALARGSCRHCRRPLPASLVSRLAWTGRCPSCRSLLGPRVWLVTLASAVAAAIAGHRVGGGPAVATFAVFAVGCVLLLFVDIAARRLPYSVTGPLAAFGLVGLGTTSYLAQDMTPTLRGLVGAAIVGGLFLGVASIRADGDGIGLGDATLAALLGLYLGWLGWRDLFWGVFLGILLGGAFAAFLLYRRGSRRRLDFAYGPFLLVGAALIMLVS
jgi:leader peptidase (prepilin peptidase)/N-methyltransferase